ncbi:TPA: hypothetical protein O7X39_004505 [Salmonella enterica]|nr:hypothetical protein [Salmonella enterica]
MLKKIKNPEGIKIEITCYQKKIREINFIFDVSINYNCYLNKLYFDINPYDEPELIEIIRITENHCGDKFTLRFETVDDRVIVLESSCELEFVFLQNMLSICTGYIDIHGECIDNFSIEFHNGLFKQLDMTKWIDSHVEEDVRLYRGDDGIIYYIKSSPWERILVNKVDVCDYGISVHAGDKNILYNTNLIPLMNDLLNIMQKIINNKK